MNNPPTVNENTSFWKRIHWSVWCLLSIAIALLIIDHWAHVLGVLPYLILLACPLMHVFMHGKHDHSSHHNSGDKSAK
jgi:hypothetical protein